jgi:hypothetical protein
VAVYTDAATAYASAVITKHKKELLKVAQGRLGIARFAVKDKQSRGEDGTVKWNKILRLGKITSARTNEYDMFAYTSAQALTANYIDSSPVTYENSIGFTDKVDLVSWIKNADNRKVIANQVARTTEYYTMKAVCTGCLRHRIDKDTTYESSFTASGTPTTTSCNTSLTSYSDDDFNGGYACFTGPEGGAYDEATKVTDFAKSNGVLTMSGTHNAPVATYSKGHIAVGTDIAATDTLSTAGLIRVSAMHEMLETEKFDGGVYRMMIDAKQHADLWADTTFLNSAIYDDSGRFKSLRVGRWFDIEFMVNSELYREDVDGTENQATGIVHVSPVFGANSFACLHWGDGDPVFGIDIFPVDNADSANLTKSRRWISWKGFFNVQVLRATSIVGLMTGATDLGIVI